MSLISLSNSNKIFRIFEQILQKLWSEKPKISLKIALLVEFSIITLKIQIQKF